MTGPRPNRSPARSESVTEQQTLVVAGPSRASRRQLGPLAWAVLEELALVAQRDDAGWVAPVGVRHVASAIGINKDTAARAMAKLGAAGVVTLTGVQGSNGRRRSGYRLHLPDGITVQACPTNSDSQSEDSLLNDDLQLRPDISDGTASVQEVNGLCERPQLTLFVPTADTMAQGQE